MSVTKILYIASEIDPFLKTSSVATLVRTLAQAMVKKKFEVRILVPRFGVINQRKNRIHEVLRLSGVNISVGQEDISLLIEVASIKEAKLQVYFIDNEDMFQRKGIFTGKEGIFYPDNDTRSIFFCKGALSTVKQLEWAPDIIHCHGWLSAFVPMYLKTTYKNNPIFKHAKCMYTAYRDSFDHTFSADILKKARLREVKETHLKPLEEANFKGFTNLATSFSDLCTRNFDQDENYPTDWVKTLKTAYIPQDEQVVDNYLKKYKQLLDNKIIGS